LAGGAFRKVVVLGAVAVAMLFPPATGAVQPFRLDSQIEDQVGALDGRADSVQAAIDELRRDEGIQLWVVYVDSFSGVAAQEWADETAKQSDLGLSDVLLAVATQDRAYAYSVDEQFPLSNDELARVADQSIEPELADGDWAGAPIAGARGLEAASGETSTGGDGGGSSVWLWLLLAGLALLGLIWWLASRARRRPQRAPVATEGNEVAGRSTEELSERGSSLLVEVDDAVKTSEQEVAFATAQFGEEAAAPFAAAVESAKADLARAFRLRREVDDPTKEDEAHRRAMLTEIIALTQGASDRIDAEAERFDELRAMERNAHELLAGLNTRLGALETRVPGVEATLAGLKTTYAGSALASVADNVQQAGERITFAHAEVAAGNQEVEAGNGGRAAVAIRGAEEAVGQAGQLLDAIDRLKTDLADADDKIRAAIPAVVEDITAVRALAGGSAVMVEHVARAEQALAAADLAASATDGQDPLGALHRLEEADKALDSALAEARDGPGEGSPRPSSA
jgi:TPM domain